MSAEGPEGLTSPPISRDQLATHLVDLGLGQQEFEADLADMTRPITDAPLSPDLEADLARNEALLQEGTGNFLGRMGFSAGRSEVADIVGHTITREEASAYARSMTSVEVMHDDDTVEKAIDAVRARFDSWLGALPSNITISEEGQSDAWIVRELGRLEHSGDEEMGLALANSPFDHAYTYDNQSTPEGQLPYSSDAQEIHEAVAWNQLGKELYVNRQNGSSLGFIASRARASLSQPDFDYPEAFDSLYELFMQPPDYQWEPEDYTLLGECAAIVLERPNTTLA